jgi:hypothetical protein
MRSCGSDRRGRDRAGEEASAGREAIDHVAEAG